MLKSMVLSNFMICARLEHELIVNPGTSCYFTEGRHQICIFVAVVGYMVWFSRRESFSDQVESDFDSISSTFIIMYGNVSPVELTLV